VIAYSKESTELGAGVGAADGEMADGMMATPEPADLRSIGPETQVTAIRYYGDTYHVTTAMGKTLPFGEFNLRFKTDRAPRGRRRPACAAASQHDGRSGVRDLRDTQGNQRLRPPFLCSAPGRWQARTGRTILGGVRQTAPRWRALETLNPPCEAIA
jgi:hypothetical protein